MYSIYSIYLVTPCLRAMKFKGAVPSIENNFVAPSAAVLGRVKLGSRSNVWNGAIIRGEWDSRRRREREGEREEDEEE